jgi:hypothetical protein
MWEVHAASSRCQSDASGALLHQKELFSWPATVFVLCCCVKACSRSALQGVHMMLVQTNMQLTDMMLHLGLIR